MRVAAINKEQAKQILETCNPMGVVEINKRLVIYKSPSDCYISVIGMLWANCPKGWIDIPYMMAKIQGLRIASAREYCGRKHYATIEWHTEPGSKAASFRNAKLKLVLCAMLRATGIDFSENAFNMAMYEFDRTINNYKELRNNNV